MTNTITFFLIWVLHTLSFNDNIYHVGNISRLPGFGICSLLDIPKRNKRLQGIRKSGNLKRKNRHALSLSDLSITLIQSGRHMALSLLVKRSISSLRNFDIEANKLYDRAHRLYDAALLTRCYTQHSLHPYIEKLIIVGILSKCNMSTKGLNSQTNTVHLRLNLLSHLFLFILKIKSHLLFVINTIKRIHSTIFNFNK